MIGTPGSASTASAPLWSVLLVPALGAATAACGAALDGAGGVRTAGGPDTGTLIGLAAAVLGCAVVAAWILAAALAVLAVLAGHHRWERLAGICGRCSPALLRRAAATALGLQLLAAPAAVAVDPPSPFWGAGASAQETAPAAEGTTSAPEETTPAPEAPGPAPAPGAGPRPGPDREPAPGGESAPAPSTAPDPCFPRTGPSVAERTVDGAVTVVRGDTLWSLAAAHLGPEASDQQVARAWPRWYELNRPVLPDGPHRLLPGQRLVVPGAGGP
ncbi:LysM peptidoglycan-binding domain-containing protein [Kocuria rosea]|uniref:LysM peptidoglycan-binding domain-containing protein n=1 Tax=Kocuria rosea TaxID=1275 RepID=UPI001110C082|nr:LysM peptidoglycan-binding domain-containing protein [Kocuria rosea]QCY32609.1 LysM peptidoglycan-binding domain-containing protein [Kocuria rosea]